jgi:hypothetical protein
VTDQRRWSIRSCWCRLSSARVVASKARFANNDALSRHSVSPCRQCRRGDTERPLCSVSESQSPLSRPESALFPGLRGATATSAVTYFADQVWRDFAALP